MFLAFSPICLTPPANGKPLDRHANARDDEGGWLTSLHLR